MYGIVLVPDFSTLDQGVGEATPPCHRATDTLASMSRNGTNAILDMPLRRTNTIPDMRGDRTNAIPDMPAVAPPPTQFRTRATGMRHHAG
jgi:hypothetical protein